jgi:predicted glycoside hydrolase/deacetylase ChbG (UPF0249 family)
VTERRVDLIVNADDFGISEENTATTVSLMEGGRVTSATILANGEDFDAAAAAARGLPSCSFGVHLNLTEGLPLTSAPDLSPLLGDDGRLRPSVFTMRITRTLLAGIEAEWVSQVERVRSAGVRVSHLDSHQHVHTIPGLFPAFKSVQKRTGIRKARITKTLYDRASPPASTLLMLKKRVWTTALRHYFRTTTTDGFSDFGSFFRAAREGPLRVRSLEVMVHPGADNELGFRDEIEILETPWEEQLPFPVRLISYHDLK